MDFVRALREWLFREVGALTSAAGAWEEECTLMCSVVVCKVRLVGKYAQAAAKTKALDNM